MIKQQHNRSSTPTPRRRTHLKPSQVAVLQESFVINSLPDSAIRSQLAHELGVSERTVQIWFQNRRAKARKLEAYTDSNGQVGSGGILIPNVRTGWVDIPPPSKPVSTLRHPSASSSSPSITTFRPFMTPERFEETRCNNRQRSFSTHPSSSVINDYENKNDNNLFINDNSPLSTTRAMSEGNHREVLHITLPTNALRIGTWARFASLTAQNELDLQCICFPFDRLFVWQIEDSGHQFRIQVNMNHVHQIRLSTSSSSTPHGHQESNNSTVIGQLELEVSQVHFSMCQLHTHLHPNQWVPCGDFSENRQASLITTHILHGNYHALKQTFMDLMTMIPDLSSKFILSTATTSSTSASASASSLDLSHYNRDLTLSPSSTPEPTSSSSAPLLFHHLPSNSTSTISSIIPNTTSTATTSNNMKQSHSSSSSTSSTTSSSSLLDDQKQFTPPSSSSSLSCSSSSTSTTTSPFMTTNNNNQWINGMNSKFSTSSTSSPYDHFVPPPPSHPLPPPPSLDQMQHYYMQMFQHQPTSMFM